MGSEKQEEGEMRQKPVNDKSALKSSAKRTQRRWKERPCMVIATSEGTFFASKKEKSAEQKVCTVLEYLLFYFFTLGCVQYQHFSYPRNTSRETREITSINSWAWPRVLEYGTRT